MMIFKIKGKLYRWEYNKMHWMLKEAIEWSGALLVAGAFIAVFMSYFRG